MLVAMTAPPQSPATLFANVVFEIVVVPST